MMYEQWRISYQSSEQAARAAFKAWQEASAAPAGYADRLAIWLKCLIRHNWLYDGPGPRNGQWHRECQRCGKRQHARYDMMYGSTDWHDD